MRLKKIKLAGFKSFVDPTTIPFPGDMTAVVGPNGCGKSNVIDAVRWVLGESSAKNLRGDAMTDVIFNGSSARKPVGQCSVELVFDNSAGRIGGEYASYAELSVRRLVTREAVSTYFLNGVKCRRRDVTDLFLGTGLGPRSYAIIEQGMISRLIESKPQDLRVFIEEAAGISKYKERRRETENRIRHTRDNLERLEDVRSELGQQLEKLQRQAAAAQRYKTLKKAERTLKSELCAIRWLKHTAHIEKLEFQQKKLQTELDALSARQRSDEAGVLKYQQQADDLKAAIDEVQQQRFAVGTAITRIEQNALHSQQRDKQISAELDELNNSRAVLAASMSEAKAALAYAQQQIDDFRPQCELIGASLDNAHEQRADAEARLREFASDTRDHEHAYLQLKHQIQESHSQIQSTMAMQLRTSQRYAELQQESDELAASEFETQLAAIDEAIGIAEHQKEERQEQVEQQRDHLSALEEALAQVQRTVNRVNGEVQATAARIGALQTLQQNEGGSQTELPDDIVALWQTLEVESGYEACVETVLHGLSGPLLSQQGDTGELLTFLETMPAGQRIFTQQSLTKKKEPGTLASKLSSSPIPSAFNHILLADDVAAAQSMLAQLQSHQSILTRTGTWLTRDWALSGQSAHEQGYLQRAALLNELNETLAQQQDALDDAEKEAVARQQDVAQQRSQLEQTTQQLQLLNADYRQQIQTKELLQRQHHQHQQRYQKVDEELSRQQALLASEEEQLATLSARLEELEDALAEREARQHELQIQRERREAAVEDARRAVDSLTSQQHQLELTLQQQESQQARYSEQVNRNQNQLHEYSEREAKLKEERRTIALPLEQQQEQLQGLLREREDIERRLAEEERRLGDTQQLIQEAQQGQQGLLKSVQQRQGEIDSLRLEIEGFRVRATGVLEQLNETGQPLKEVLENLSEEHDEQNWQQELEKTQAAVARLGAVNLAAVEEYEIQSERKNYLDAQNADLSEALETLQNAIRKIDKETRSRFSQTFEQVNEDLKQLFPKVFGGGAAYLALTDDDLLETGVTIMARPPGKKNSTIHLLSGGEKALTALSLVFAIFRLNPAPFCLLDEVDAPLDDANVGRFCKLVSEMSQTVQFIYITHNKIAMEMASHLTGVTMAEPGVSRMVAVDVDEAVAFTKNITKGI